VPVDELGKICPKGIAAAKRLGVKICKRGHRGLLK
jgi:hypothetical protein